MRASYNAVMPRVPLAGFEPALQRRLETLWGKPVNLYRALGNSPALVAAFYAMVARMLDAMAVPRDDELTAHSPRLR